MSGNPHPRGEVDVVVAGETYTLRASFKAIAQLRKALGESLTATTRRFYNAPYDYGPEEIEAVIRAAAVEKKPPANLGDLIMAEGPVLFAPAITLFLVGACTGGLEGNAAAPATPTPAPAT